jgi:hypothetical protein
MKITSKFIKKTKTCCKFEFLTKKLKEKKPRDILETLSK